ATSSGNGNGVFTTTAGAYPSTTGNGDYYWIDAVFSTNGSATTPLTVTKVQPKNNAYGVKRNQPLTASFNYPLNSGTVTASTVQLFDASNNQVAGSPSYSSASRTVTFTPSSTLSYGQKYTLKLAASVASTTGATLGGEYSWSFTIGSQLLSDPATGQGGPILVVTSTTNKYSTYYAEILRTEGLNYFDTQDLSTVTSTVLGNYDAVVLPEMTLSQSQADMFSTWVSSGGNLVAMRPDKKLATLLGLTDASSTRSNQYMLVDTGSGPGVGIVNETIQFKGTADNYTLNGATAVASFYSDASTSTSNPAVTSRSVGSNGGTAMAFAYDLAKSVIALHQGNQAWAGQDRDGSGMVRTNDLFFGARSGDVQPDWVDLNKLHIPQADEQQRLLANLLTSSTKDKKPLPRFWYLPGNNKAAMILAGDDHGLDNTGTERIISNWLNESSASCSPIDWECVTASHYTYSTSALTNTRAVQYIRLGYDIGAHVSNGGACNDYTSFSNLSTLYTNNLATWRAKYTGAPNQRTGRFHCYIWSDWDSQPRVQIANGMRFGLEYVAYPNSWVGTRAPMLTGSGMNMRLTDADGDLLDGFQGVTNLDDTAAGTTSINALLDNAIGSAGYYGIFGTHYDMSNSYHTTVFAAAKARNIPMISADEALTWLDGRGSSRFSGFTGSSGQFGFTLDAAEGAVGLKAMLPVQDAAGTLSTLKLAGQDVTYQTQTVKGVQYAVFDGQPGAYTATYSDYNPNPTPNPGGNSGGSSGESDAGGSTSTGTTSKKTTKKSTGIFNDSPDTDVITGQNQEQQDKKGEQPTTSTPNKPDLREKELIQNDSGKEGSSWLVWLGSFGLVAFLGGLFWFVLAKRRHRGQPQW
ncbi:MAG TPA: Ig-like domain-containing protein, partial [Candidatus Saccharimonadales bacterium]